MSYQIQYSPESIRKYPMVKHKHSIRLRYLVTTLFFVAAGLWIKTNGIPDFLIPGDPEVTRTAAVVFVDHLRNGGPVDQAFTVFCQQILDGAKA